MVKNLPVWGRMDTCICMAESLCCSPENITTLLIGHSPIQNKNKNNKKRICLPMQEMQEMWVLSLGQADPWSLAWKIPWTKEPGGLQSMGSQRVGHY